MPEHVRTPEHGRTPERGRVPACVMHVWRRAQGGVRNECPPPPIGPTSGGGKGVRLLLFTEEFLLRGDGLGD